MLEWLTKQGWGVKLKPGWVLVTRGDQAGNYHSISDAYFALGGPVGSCIYNPKGRPA